MQLALPASWSISEAVSLSSALYQKEAWYFPLFKKWINKICIPTRAQKEDSQELLQIYWPLGQCLQHRNSLQHEFSKSLINV